MMWGWWEGKSFWYWPICQHPLFIPLRVVCAPLGLGPKGEILSCSELFAKSRDFTIQEWTKCFLTSPPLTVQSRWPHLILSPTTKQIHPRLIWHFLRNPCTTQILPYDLIILVADTRLWLKQELWLTQFLCQWLHYCGWHKYSHHLCFPQRPLISNKKHFIFSVTSASSDI